MKCSAIDCEAEAMWAPLLKLPISEDMPPAMGSMDCFLCDEHKEGATLAHFFSSESFEVLAQAFEENGYARPDPAAVTLEWEMLT